MPKLNLETLQLAAGKHDAESGEACLLEAVSVAAGDPWTDHPPTASPVLAAYGRRLNDRLNDEDRQRLLPFVERLVGTAGNKALDNRRALLAIDHAIRTALPRWLELAGETAHADGLRALPAFKSAAEAAAAVPLIHAARQATWPKRQAFREKVAAAVREKMKEKPVAAAAAAAVAAYAVAAYAAADAAAAAAADAAAAVAAYAAAAVAAYAAAADAAAADAAAAVAAYAAAADAAAAAYADAAADADRWSKVYDATYKAVRKAIEEKLGANPTYKSGVDDAIGLFDRMVELK